MVPENLLSEQEISILQRRSLPADIRLLMCSDYSDYFDSALAKPVLMYTCIRFYSYF